MSCPLCSKTIENCRCVPERGPTLAGAEVARQALDDLAMREATARIALADFALRALIAGEDIDAIMDACGIEEVREERALPSYADFLMGRGRPRYSRREVFAQWLAEAVRDRVMDA